MVTSIKTRGKIEVWLIRETIDEINTNKLPSNGDILRRTLKKHVALYMQRFISYEINSKY